MTAIFGENYHFTNHTYDYLGMVPRSHNSFHDVLEEIGKSRVFAGIHYTVACVQGRIQGEKIAKNINAKLTFLKE